MTLNHRRLLDRAGGAAQCGPDPMDPNPGRAAKKWPGGLKELSFDPSGTVCAPQLRAESSARSAPRPRVKCLERSKMDILVLSAASPGQQIAAVIRSLWGKLI